MNNIYPALISSLAGLDIRCFAESSWSERSWEDLLNQKQNQLFIHKERGEIIGFLLANSVAGESELLKVGVSPDFQKQGIAHKLVEQMIDWARQGNIEKIFLEVHEQNTSAIRLYEQFYFLPTGRRKGYYLHPPGDALIYQLEL